MSNPEHDLEGPPVPITHAQHHPELLQQSIVERPAKRVVSEAHRASLNLGRDTARENRAKLNDRLRQFVEEQDKVLEQIALEEDTTIEHCRELLRTTLKKKRKESAQNAFVSLKALELNADRAPGNKLKLKDIQAAVVADKTMQEATEEEKQKVKELLAEKRLEKVQGARGSHAGESKDMAAFSRRMGIERTGAIGFKFVTRNDNDSNGAACWWSTGNAVHFVKERLNMGMWDMQRSFESWAVAASSAAVLKGPSNMKDRKKACAEIILSNLVYISHSKDIQMSYANYDRDIIMAYKVHLIGWPPHVPFGAPSGMSRNGDIRDLLEALESGACCWARVSKKELDAARTRVASELPKKRKGRSDIGGTHAKPLKGRKKRGAAEIEHSDNDGEPGPSKHRRKSAGSTLKKSVAAAFPSAEFIESDDGDGDDE
ncbi:hypothetical protein C8J56DRAFT_1051189 [Mycena floridula]|nr:hypothetical protein C8J56DRAFT_1051189 [Mycena floridula]